jgi:hypothetical protein
VRELFKIWDRTHRKIKTECAGKKKVYLINSLIDLHSQLLKYKNDYLTLMSSLRIGI